MRGGTLALAALLLACADRRAPPPPKANSSAAHRDLGVQWMARARLNAEAGQDPFPAALRGLSELDEARILDSADPLVVEEMARAHVFLADHLLRRGGDPRPELEQARAMLALEAHMAPPTAAELALTALERALEVEWVLGREENPAAPLAQGIDLARRALEAEPRAADAHVALARMHLAISRAGRSSSELEAASRELDAAADIAPDLAELARLRAQVDPHSPAKFRVNGPLSNMPEFAAAFQCKEGDPMVRQADKRCQIW
jgi:hypothetical protein